MSQVLRGLYPLKPSNVDAELADAFVRPAETEGALKVLRQIYTGDPGPCLELPLAFRWVSVGLWNLRKGLELAVKQ